MGLFTCRQVVRTRSLNKDLFKERALFFHNASCWFYCACDPSAYFIIMHLSSLSSACNSHKKRVLRLALAGKKHAEEFRNKMHIMLSAESIYRERIGQRVGRACAAKELRRRAATFRCRSCRNVAEHWREIIGGQKRANARVGPPAYVALLGVSFFFWRLQGC
jgi:hypothetical protein